MYEQKVLLNLIDNIIVDYASICSYNIVFESVVFIVLAIIMNQSKLMN